MMIKEAKIMSESTNDKLSDIVGIRLKGGTFSVPTDLTFFPSPQENQKNNNKSPKLQKDIIIYGRNGTGKSTIARAIKSIAGERQPTIQDAQFFDKNRQPISLAEGEEKRIFVFNEEFIDKNIKLQENGLDTIVMLGEHIDLKNQIYDQKNALDDYSKKYADLKAIVNKYNDSKNIESPFYWFNQIKHALQGDSNWAGRTKAIRNLKQNAPVNDATYNQFIQIQPSDSQDNLHSQFAEKIQKLIDLRQYASDQPITIAVPFCNLEDYNEEHIQELLAQKIERPIMSDREKKLVELGVDKLEMRHNTFSDPSITECPYCFQPISQDYKYQLIKNIEKALHQTVNQHGDELRKCWQKPVELNLSPYRSLPSYRKCQDLLENLNQAIRFNNKKLEQKYYDPYTPIIENIAPVNEHCAQLNIVLKNLEQERIQFNDKNSVIKELQNELTQLNNEITYYDIHEFVNRYREQCHSRDDINFKLEGIGKTIKKYEENLDSLNAKLKSVTIAMNLINGYLQYIFFDKNRLRIDFQKDVYVLHSNGHSVRPSDISTGERNILALCYFFARIMQGQNPAEAGTKDYLLVIDDPVSSFDMGNRVGIMSFLNFQIKQFLTGNPQTHFIILTHNLQVYYDLENTFQAIYNLLKNNSKRKFQGAELSKHQFIEITNNSRQEYSALMSIIYDYAAGKSDVISAYDLSIGNMMRQVLEAFTTFLYKKGINEIINDKDISEILKQKQVQPYFGRLMYGMMLNDESHTETKVQTMQNMEFLPSYSQEEKQKIAKSILCLIYLLNPKHLHSHLARKPDLEITMKRWCKEIREENPSMT